MIERLSALAVIVAVLSAAPAPALAAEITSQELVDLAQRALSDEEALRALREVDSIDGRPVDMQRVLGTDEDQLRDRLETISRSGAGSPPSDTAAARAREVLDDRRFKPSPVPRPFQGLLRKLGEWLRPVTDALTKIFDAIAQRVPGGDAALWTIIAGVVVGVAFVVFSRAARRRTTLISQRTRFRRSRELDPGVLEKDAAAAERSGDHEKAIRLLFKAGLLRLSAMDRIEFRPSITTSEVAESLHSRAFEDLARVFDEVVYGRRPPGAGEVVRSRRGWEIVLGDRERAA